MVIVVLIEGDSGGKSSTVTRPFYWYYHPNTGAAEKYNGAATNITFVLHSRVGGGEDSRIR